MKQVMALGLVILTAPLSAEAEVALQEVNGCIENARSLGTSPMTCVDNAHVPCLEIPAETPNVATLCFKEAQDTWSGAMTTALEVIKDNLPDIAPIASIEVKYDLLSGLLQCDRMAELAALQNAEDEKILLQKTRCSATASGLAYVRLVWRAPEGATHAD